MHFKWQSGSGIYTSHLNLLDLSNTTDSERANESGSVGLDVHRHALACSPSDRPAEVLILSDAGTELCRIVYTSYTAQGGSGLVDYSRLPHAKG